MLLFQSKVSHNMPVCNIPPRSTCTIKDIHATLALPNMWTDKTTNGETSGIKLCKITDTSQQSHHNSHLWFHTHSPFSQTYYNLGFLYVVSRWTKLLVNFYRQHLIPFVHHHSLHYQHWSTLLACIGNPKQEWPVSLTRGKGWWHHPLFAPVVLDGIEYTRTVRTL